MKGRPRPLHIKVYGKPIPVEEIYTVESAFLHEYFYSTYQGTMTLEVKSNILDKALQFCKERVEIMNCIKDEKLRQEKLEDFEAKFLKEIQSDHDDAMIQLIDAAFMLEIDSLMKLLIEPVVEMMSDKPHQELEKMFPLRCYDGDDRIFYSMAEDLGYVLLD